MRRGASPDRGCWLSGSLPEFRGIGKASATPRC